MREESTPVSKNRGKGHQLYQRLNQMIQQSSDWTAEDKALLKIIAAQGFEHLGLKKDDYKKILRTLDA